VKMAPEQRLALISLFIGTIRTQCREELASRYVMSLDYIRALRDVVKLPLALGLRVTSVRMRAWSVSSFFASLRQLALALEECGATIPGAEECWRAHWSAFRFLLILDEEPLEHVPTSGHVATNPGLSADTIDRLRGLGIDVGADTNENPLWRGPTARLKRA